MLKVDRNDEQVLYKALKDEDLEDMAVVSMSGDFIQVAGLHRSEEFDLMDQLNSKNVGFSIVEE